MNLSDDCKKKCQIFTPKNTVKELLDWVGYNENLYGKKNNRTKLWTRKYTCRCC